MAYVRQYWLLDLVRAVIGSLISIGFAWAIASFLPLYELAADAGETRRLPVAYGVAWLGIVMSLAYPAMLMLAALRARGPIGWMPLVAVPLLVGSWVAGFLVAIVVSG
ncbi:hypothetical protein ACFQZZ_03760 [Nocardia sp. GCM10030253]|uniref:hypothetical protein n=1 Tax=Nocardia sp. GCM10030253 TaxID=3273404 RepID=UPI003641DAAE